jgi:environmental stress-induced protein Ves
MTVQSWRVISPDRYRDMPWKNGLGVTTEIATKASDLGGFTWRISRAKIAASGPFSAFIGYERLITHLGGGAVSLSHADGTRAELQPFAPYAFSGDIATEAELRGDPAEDFNLITRRGECRGMMVCDDLPQGTPHLLAAAALTTHFVYVLSGCLELVGDGPGLPLSASQLSSALGPAVEPVRLRALAVNTKYLLASITLGTAL